MKNPMTFRPLNSERILDTITGRGFRFPKEYNIAEKGIFLFAEAQLDLTHIVCQTTFQRSSTYMNSTLNQITLTYDEIPIYSTRGKMPPMSQQAPWTRSFLGR